MLGDVVAVKPKKSRRQLPERTEENQRESHEDFPVC